MMSLPLCDFLHNYVVLAVGQFEFVGWQKGQPVCKMSRFTHFRDISGGPSLTRGNR